MRKSLCFLLSTIGFVAIRGYSGTDNSKAPLSFYIVSENKVDGGRFIDTPDFPKLGYVAAKPALVVTQLVAVTATNAITMTFDEHGNRTDNGSSSHPVLNVKLRPEDANAFEVLTAHNIGRRVLLMLGDVPLIAPVVQSPISTDTFEITTREFSDEKKIEAGLKKLVQ